MFGRNTLSFGTEIGSNDHFHSPFRSCIEIVATVDGNAPTTADEAKSLGFKTVEFRAISRRWKYAPETIRAMMMMDWIGYDAAREVTATRGVMVERLIVLNDGE